MLFISHSTLTTYRFRSQVVALFVQLNKMSKTKTFPYFKLRFSDHNNTVKVITLWQCPSKLRLILLSQIFFWDTVFLVNLNFVATYCIVQ